MKAVEEACTPDVRKNRETIMQTMKDLQGLYAARPLPACGLCSRAKTCPVSNDKLIDVLFPPL